VRHAIFRPHQGDTRGSHGVGEAHIQAIERVASSVVDPVSQVPFGPSSDFASSAK
jgi:hypothetical protein